MNHSAIAHNPEKPLPAGQSAALARAYLDAVLSDALVCLEVNLSRNCIDRISGKDAALYEELRRFGAVLSYTGVIAWEASHLIAADCRTLYQERLDRSHLLSRFARGETHLRFECRRVREGAAGEIWVRITGHLLRDGAGTLHLLLYEEDVDAQRSRLETLKFQAQRDLLTGLYNQSAGEALISEKLSAAPKGQHAFLIFDIDRFKEVNDTFGHQRGDRLLAEVARLLSSQLRAEDVAVRLGGDEYAVFLQGFAGLDQIEKKAARLLSTISSIGETGEPPFRSTVSTGIAVAPQHGTDCKTLYRHADAALYFVKRNGKNGFAFYDPSPLRMRKATC